MGISKQFFLFVMASLLTTSAFAENTAPTQPTKVYVHRTYEHQEADRNDHIYTPNLGRAGEMAISDNDRVLLGRYVAHYYKNTCPWEHDLRVKKCVAPTAPQKRPYMIGYGLPSDVVTEDVPQQIVARLRPIPYGYKYVRVGNDVLLINGSNREVIDHVTLLSTYGQ
ncbi:MAG: hypothetical protein A3J37_06185 [Alphaproteobacteria bacterium RIFCSPHIGHO2_12_FULL_45_9]|nr:MAG: hypothetical protein A3B66_05590 [Alphaproteobacteria bacterium RIFCSPHIGHO2_02_FULL_46_13]OFW94595.1 MAG: hypothetical protein A3J37_06185 [Alphaproteobacteria bacterium RIFCSPHIGHO2_12_FULL_45_9]